MTPEANAVGEMTSRRVGVPLTLAIFVLPPIFAWFLLRRGYSSASRIGAFAYMVLNIVIDVAHHLAR